MDFNPELCRNESEVESKLIVQYLLPQLGYTPDSWYQEVAVGSIRLDFLAFAAQVIPFMLDDNSPLSVVMEAKSPNQNLDTHVRKLKRYLVSLNVQYGLLTNGKEIRIFERVGSDIQLRFNCLGREVATKIDDIRILIGKDTLKASPSSTEQDPPRKYPMKTIAVYHNKGGVGKTTVSVNLAAGLTRKNKKVLLIDIDAQANSTFATGLIKFQFDEEDNLKDSNVYHLLESGDFNFIEDVARKSNFFTNPEIDVIPSHITLVEYQDKLTRIAVSRSRLTSKLKRVESKYDYVIIDAPPSRDLYAEVAMIAADYLIIPSDLKPFANQGLPNVQGFINQVNEYREDRSIPPITLLGILPSKISTHPQFLKHTFPKQREAISQRYDMPLMDSIIFERAFLSHCINQTITVGDLEIPDPKSVFDFAPDSPSAEEFEALTNEVLNKTR
ncbi:AAA family ATPase [Trichocoleus sp. FACHB-591]|uniref:AAA family ATPase n=1 Tax=Trichocoleus sp. FACHB-591 TaxID=2692872 RepID=UPI001682F936|nr:AAA family ATPase [Trichocoleus sp. FACHB-591]MBD2096200.1 AAA family ATPase [Trichocoleus sp. FACHB-591]